MGGMGGGGGAVGGGAGVLMGLSLLLDVNEATFPKLKGGGEAIS
jgi:hypothetical protein